jgi:hypothetical protein
MRITEHEKNVIIDAVKPPTRMPKFGFLTPEWTITRKAEILTLRYFQKR